MTRPNVRIMGTSITHAKAIGGLAVTRCGVLYDRVSEPWSNPHLLGVATEDAIDCMTCLIKDDATDEDLFVTRTVFRYGVP